MDYLTKMVSLYQVVSIIIVLIIIIRVLRATYMSFILSARVLIMHDLCIAGNFHVVVPRADIRFSLFNFRFEL